MSNGKSIDPKVKAFIKLLVCGKFFSFVNLVLTIPKLYTSVLVESLPCLIYSSGRYHKCLLLLLVMLMVEL